MIKKIIKFLKKKKKKYEIPYTREALPKYEIGEYTYGTPIIYHWGEAATLKIGRFCSIASDVKIFLGGNHRMDWITTYPFNAFSNSFPNAKSITGHPASKGDVVIGNDVWIGNNVIILSGVSIQDGAVIGAGAVLSKNVGPYEVWAGNPAKLIRKRFTQDQINLLIEIKWWEWPEEKINEHVSLLCSDDLDNLSILIQNTN